MQEQIPAGGEPKASAINRRTILRASASLAIVSITPAWLAERAEAMGRAPAAKDKAGALSSASEEQCAVCACECGGKCSCGNCPVECDCQCACDTTEGTNSVLEGKLYTNNTELDNTLARTDISNESKNDKDRSKNATDEDPQPCSPCSCECGEEACDCGECPDCACPPVCACEVGHDTAVAHLQSDYTNDAGLDNSLAQTDIENEADNQKEASFRANDETTGRLHMADGKGQGGWVAASGIASHRD